MLISKAFIFMILFAAVSLFSTTSAQSFGFGCLGFVGGYGGYSYQKYTPKGFNDYITSFNSDHNDSSLAPMGKFGIARGYRVGLNFFRANIKGFILTTKGFYQALSEKKEAYVSAAGGSTVIYDLEMKNWGVGIDLGTALTGALSWKVVDAAVLFNTASFTNTMNSPGPTTSILEYNSDKTYIGYSVGTGFILAIIDNYISIEGMAGYTALKIDKMQLSNGTILTADENSSEPMKNFISAGGFNAVIQLNIGFPL